MNASKPNRLEFPTFQDNPPDRSSPIPQWTTDLGNHFTLIAFVSFTGPMGTELQTAVGYKGSRATMTR